MRHHCFRPHKLELLGARDIELAGLLRCCAAHAGELLAFAPAVPFPQQSCNLAFGEHERPLPIGALVHLWRGWPLAVARCEGCRGAAFLYSLTFGDADATLELCCTICAMLFHCEVDGRDELIRSLYKVLGSTPFAVTDVCDEPLTGNAGELYASLHVLGALDARPSGTGALYAGRLAWFRHKMR